MHKGIHFFVYFLFSKKQTYLEISLLLLRCLYPLQKCCSWLVLITLFFEADLFWEKNICGLIIWLCVYMFVYIHVSFAIYHVTNLGKCMEVEGLLLCSHPPSQLECMYNLPPREKSEREKKKKYIKAFTSLCVFFIFLKKRKASSMLLRPCSDCKGMCCLWLCFCDSSSMFFSKLSHGPFECGFMHRYPIPWWWWRWRNLAFIILLLIFW